MSGNEKPDDSEPTPERQAQLQAAYDANVGAGEAPYKGVPIKTRGELSWVMQERRWSGEFASFVLSEGFERANLRGADLFGADLSEAELCGADLSYADLRYTTLSGANPVALALDWGAWASSLVSKYVTDNFCT